MAICSVWAHADECICGTNPFRILLRCAPVLLVLLCGVQGRRRCCRPTLLGLVDWMWGTVRPGGAHSPRGQTGALFGMPTVLCDAAAAVCKATCRECLRGRRGERKPPKVMTAMLAGQYRGTMVPFQNNHRSLWMGDRGDLQRDRPLVACWRQCTKCL